MELLREFVTLLINETPIVPKEATQQGLAMLRYKGHVVLYDPNIYVETVRDALSNSYGSEDDMSDAIEQALTDPVGIYGYFWLAPPDRNACAGALRMKYVAARKGYGPLMYDIALSMAPKGIVPDRKHVSVHARKVWAYYFYNRHDVIKTPLGEDINGKRIAKKSCKLYNDPEAPYLDVVYRATRTPGTSRMSDKHFSLVYKIESMLIQAGIPRLGKDFYEMLAYTAAGKFFNDAFPGR